MESRCGNETRFVASGAATYAAVSRDTSASSRSMRRRARLSIGGVEEERALSLAWNGGVAKPASLENGELELVVDHVIVLTDSPVVTEDGSRPSEKRIRGGAISAGPARSDASTRSAYSFAASRSA